MGFGKTAAIALTVIIALPILLGYGLAFDEVEKTGYKENDRMNATDLILNHNTPYYASSASPGNNAELIGEYIYIGQGITETKIIAPYYVSGDSTYSSLPIYSQTSGTLELVDPVVDTTTGTDHGTYTSIDYGDQIPADKAWYIFDSSELAQLTKSNGTADYSTVWGTMVQDSGNTWTGPNALDYSVTIGTNCKIVSDRSPTYTITSRDYTDLDMQHDYSISIPGTWCLVKLTMLDDSVQYVRATATSAVSIYRSGSVVTVGNDVYNSVKLVSVAPVLGTTGNLTYYYTAQTGSYGDPAYGWEIQYPGDPNIALYVYWMNGQINKSVRFFVNVYANENAFFRAYNGTTPGTNVSLVNTSGQPMKVNGQSLGDYVHLCVDVNTDSIVVSGVRVWPTMGIQPELLNSITIPYTDIGQITKISIGGSSNIDFRVDNAEILAGTFPSTYNATLNMSNYWPGEDYSIVLTSIGVYGDSITFGGHTYAVNDNTITLNGKKVQLKNMVFSSILDDDEYINSINGTKIGSTLVPASLYFGGEWSATVSAYSMVEVTGKSLEWQPGEFAFNGIDTNFALWGLIASAAAFIGLGLYGVRTGMKVLWLMLACGGAAAVFLIML